LGSNDIDDEGASVCLGVLTNWNTTLTELPFYNNNISQTVYSDVVGLIDANKIGIRLLHAGPKLDLSCKDIDDAQAKRVATELADNTTVTAVALNMNEIGRRGCTYIANALTKNHVLISIELNDNSVGNDGCAAVATMLQVNMVLTKVLLNGNRIGLAGAAALAETLLINTSLRELGLGVNCVRDEGGAAIAGALRCNTTLERLDLSRNSIGGKGTKAILEALTEINCSLTWLNLDCNAAVSWGLRKEIGFMLASRRVLKSFCNFLVKPLDKKLIPTVIHALRQSSNDHEKLDPAHCQETRAGPIFLLVRSTALNDSRVIKVTPTSRKRSRTPRLFT
jgi:Ran GTPase-activating protein (RanGAP) involved in mRNA processing and transport